MIDKLESNEISLKESIELYSQGAKLLGKCKEQLTGIEKEMIVIGESMESEEE
jgi:exodeoxyribonuclease VII small subunit